MLLGNWTNRLHLATRKHQERGSGAVGTVLVSLLVIKHLAKACLRDDSFWVKVGGTQSSGKCGNWSVR